MWSNDVPGRLAYPIWHPTTFVGPAPASAMIAVANWNRFDFCLATLPSRQRSDTSAANKNCRMRLMIVSKSRLQATLPEEQSGRLSPCRIGDSVLYRSLLGFARPVASSQKPVSGQQQEAEKAGPGAQSMSVNACLQLSAYSLGANLSSISHSQLELQLPEQPLKPAAHARWLPSPQQEC